VAARSKLVEFCQAKDWRSQVQALKQVSHLFSQGCTACPFACHLQVINALKNDRRGFEQLALGDATAEASLTIVIELIAAIFVHPHGNNEIRRAICSAIRTLSMTAKPMLQVIFREHFELSAAAVDVRMLVISIHHVLILGRTTRSSTLAMGYQHCTNRGKCMTVLMDTSTYTATCVYFEPC
jgi:hypothetical protein